MDKLILGLIVLVICFVIRFVLFVWKNRKKKKKTKTKQNKTILEINYLITRFKLEEKDLKKKSNYAMISLLDALIIAITFTVVILITNILILQLLIGLVVAMGLIFATFELYGKYLVKKYKK